MSNVFYEWLFWILIGVSSIIGFIAIQLLLSRLAEKAKKDGKETSNSDSKDQ